MCTVGRLSIILAGFLTVCESTSLPTPSRSELLYSSAPLQLPRCLKPEPAVSFAASSVHQLRLGDVRVLAAMGDSFTAGFMARSSNVLQLQDYKDVSFSAGTASDIFTVAGMLRQFSGRLAVHTGRLHPLNVARTGAQTDDLMRQARQLIASVRARPDIDARRDWKIVTILIGNNDLCRNCRGTLTSAAQADVMVKRVQDVLDLLRSDLPRTLVNLLPSFDFRVSFNVKRRPTCSAYYKVACPCASHLLSQPEVVQRQEDFNSRLEALVASGRYDQDLQFTVVLQPFTGNARAPRDPDTGYVQREILAPDCFHPGLFAHQIMAKMLWNNMLSPEGYKSLDGSDIDDGIRCPSYETPYIPTRKNSHVR